MNKIILLIGLLTYSSLGWSKSFLMSCPPDIKFLKHDMNNLSSKKSVSEKMECWWKGNPCQVRWIRTINQKPLGIDTKDYDFLFSSNTIKKMLRDENRVEGMITNSSTECKLVN
jgi:hypothetical protein